MEKFAIAVKAVIINQRNHVLLIKRRQNDVHKPGVWEIPGGRMSSVDANPFDELKREVREEVGLEIDILQPLRIHHFTRDDGQKITMLVFLCKATKDKVVVSEEHTDFVWESPEKAKETIVPEFRREIEAVEKIYGTQSNFHSKKEA